MLPPEKRLRWSKSYRLISTRYPPVDLFERVADPADWEALAAIEMLTNPRVRDQIGEISLVKPKERVSGPRGVLDHGSVYARRTSLAIL